MCFPILEIFCRGTNVGLFVGGQRIGGRRGTDNRKGVCDGSYSEHRDHTAHAEMRSEQISELTMRLSSFQEPAGRSGNRFP